ncbi:DNA-binding protein [Salmonella enterica]|nr:DNA-binding protein [Salmonella enterica]EAU0090963.1 DNA-binding protein [Salmonella enterica]
MEYQTVRIEPNKWGTESLLMAITGLTKNAIRSAREKSWMEGREYRHYSGDCQPKDNSPIMYNRLEVDAWVERQKLPFHVKANDVGWTGNTLLKVRMFLV